MHETAIVLSRPEQPRRLVLLHHGVGSSAANLAPLGKALSEACPHAMVVSVNAPHPSTLGSGREWFSVLGITEQNRPERIRDALPLFFATLAHWQQASGIGPDGTVLVGFSQGAILSLESTQVEREPVGAHRVISLAGRFAGPVRRAPACVNFHLIHGDQDRVVAATSSVAAAAELRSLGAPATLDLLPQLGHGIDPRAVRLVVRYVGEEGADVVGGA